MGHCVEVYLEEDEGYASVEDAWEDAGDGDKARFVSMYGSEIQEYMDTTDPASNNPHWMDDPVQRLGVIVWLRAHGYTVEYEGEVNDAR